MKILQGKVFRATGQIAVPKGGATGAALRKASAKDSDVSWQPLKKTVFIFLNEATGIASCNTRPEDIISAMIDGTRVVAEFSASSSEVIPYQIPVAGYSLTVDGFGSTSYSVAFAGFTKKNGILHVADFLFENMPSSAETMTGTGRLIPLE